MVPGPYSAMPVARRDGEIGAIKRGRSDSHDNLVRPRAWDRHLLKLQPALGNYRRLQPVHLFTS